MGDSQHFQTSGGFVLPSSLYDCHYAVIKVKGFRTQMTPQMVMEMFSLNNGMFTQDNLIEFADVPAPSGVFVPTKLMQNNGEAFIIFPNIRPTFSVFFGYVQKCVENHGAQFDICKPLDLVTAMFSVLINQQQLQPTSDYAHGLNYMTTVPAVPPAQPALPPLPAPLVPPPAVPSPPTGGMPAGQACAGFLIGPPHTLPQPVPGTGVTHTVQPSLVFELYNEFPVRIPMVISRNCLVLRGIPYNARLDDICLFLQDFVNHFRREDLIIFVNALGLFNGVAFVEMVNEDVAAAATARLNRSVMTCGGRSRYIEVFQSNHYDILTNSMLHDSKPILGIFYVPPMQLYMGNCSASQTVAAKREE